MSTKRLSRTVLEAGQWRYRRRYCKAASGAERSEARVRMAAAGRDADEAEQLHIRPRKRWRKDFAPDKLSAVERWLYSQIGRPWMKVEGEIRSRFDTRTVPGRHIVFDHLLPGRLREAKTGWHVGGRYLFYVDAHGFLRARQRVSRKRPAMIRYETVEWLGDRKIAVHRKGRGAAYWLVDADTPVYAREQPRHYRQAARLDPQELDRLAQLNPVERAAFVVEFE